jgi:hypothetical protein
MYQTPFTPAFSTPGTEGSGVASRGGADLGEGSAKETPNQSGIPNQPDLYSVDGGPGAGTTVGLPDLTNRTIPTRKD